MKLFRWPSQTLEGETFGDILVLAENVSEAREKALAYAKENAFSHGAWTKVEVEKFVADVEFDINLDDYTTESCVFIDG